MNNTQKIIVLALLFCGLLATRASADDGRLVLDTNTITNQASSNAASTTFPIRADLFTPAMEARVKSQKNEATQALKKVDEVSFKQAQVNPLYTASYQGVKTALFKNYRGVNLSNSESTDTSSTHQVLLILGLAALPLLVVTGFVARRFARRKKRQ